MCSVCVASGILYTKSYLLSGTVFETASLLPGDDFFVLNAKNSLGDLSDPACGQFLCLSTSRDVAQ